jgi:hypothetical protein
LGSLAGKTYDQEEQDKQEEAIATDIPITYPGFKIMHDIQ